MGTDRVAALGQRQAAAKEAALDNPCVKQAALLPNKDQGHQVLEVALKVVDGGSCKVSALARVRRTAL